MSRPYALLLALLLVLVSARPAAAETYVPVTGSGSTWSQVAIEQWSKDVKKFGLTVNYSGTGSSAGRSDFRQAQSDFGVSEIPFQLHPEDGSPPETTSRPYAYMPIVAGGTSFMYHLTQNGKRIEGLRLSGETLAKIFTGKITNWSDPAITKDMKGIALPNKKITPVVRSDGSGTTAQFSLWMDTQYPDIWRPFFKKRGLTSFFPPLSGGKAQNGSNGVAGYVSASYGEGSIGYVEYAYALNARFPVAKLKNKAGYYSLPTASNVGVALTKAGINSDLTQDLNGVYNNADKRTYPMSSYSYMIIPTSEAPPFNEDKGKSLSTFINYFLCTGQSKAPELGYSPLPKNLVQAAYTQLQKIPGHIPLGAVDGAFLEQCNNPTFKGGKNVLLANAPQPQECDKEGQTPCGLAAPTPTSSAAAPGAGPSGAGTAPAGTAPAGTAPVAAWPEGSAFAQPVEVVSSREYGLALGALSAGMILAALIVPPVLTAWLRGRRRGNGEI